MSDVTLEQVWQMIEQLNPKDRDTLMSRLQIRSPYKTTSPITFTTIMAERTRRIASGESLPGLPSLRNAYSDANFSLTDEQLRDSIKGFSNEWEQELDDYHPQD